MNIKLNEKKAIITGSTGGMGYAMAKGRHSCSRARMTFQLNIEDGKY